MTEDKKIDDGGLAAEQAQPVAWAMTHNGSVVATTSDLDTAVHMKAVNLNCEVIPLYAHPPAPHPVAVEAMEEAIRLAEIGEYLYNRAYSYGNGYDEPREFGIEWQWQQSKTNEFGQGALLAEATKWHSDMAEDGIETEAAKLRSALVTAPAKGGCDNG